MFEEILRMAGAGGEVLLAASVGFVAWYLVKVLRIGRTFGALVTALIRYGAAIFAFLAVGIVLGWVDLSTASVFTDLGKAGGFLWEIVAEKGDDIIRWLENLAPAE